MKKKQTNVDVVMPRIVQGKDWYIEYKCFYAKTDKLEKFREYKGFIKYGTVEEKLKFGNKKVKALSKKLKSGWRPWDASQYIYHDEIQYHNQTERFGDKKINNSHIRKHLSGFLQEIKRKLTAKSYSSYQSKTRIFCEWLEKNGYSNARIFEINDSVTKKFFNYLVDERKLDRVTIDKYQQNLNAMFKSFVKRKLIDKVPLESIVKPPKLKDCAARPIQDVDVQRLLKHMAANDPQMLLASLMQFFLCCRPGNELRLLKIEDIDIYNRTVHILEGNAKTTKRKITIPDALCEIILEFKILNNPHDFLVFSKGGKPGKIALGKNYFGNRFRDFRKKLNLSHSYKFYSFKHTGAGKLLESQATIVEVMKHLGHKNIETTMAYIKRHFGDQSEKVLNFRPDVLKGII